MSLPWGPSVHKSILFLFQSMQGASSCVLHTGREGKMSPWVNGMHLKKASNAYTIRTWVWEVFCFFVEIPWEGCSGLDSCEGRNLSAGMKLPALACLNPSLSRHCSLSPDTCPRHSETHPSSWVLLQSNVCYSRADPLSYKCQWLSRCTLGRLSPSHFLGGQGHHQHCLNMSNDVQEVGYTVYPAL